jgi:hypothetical protein
VDDVLRIRTETPAATLPESALSEIHPVDWQLLKASATAGLGEESPNCEPSTVTLTLPVEALLVFLPGALLVRRTLVLKAPVAVPTALRDVIDTMETLVTPELALHTTEPAVTQLVASSVLPPILEVALSWTEPKLLPRTVTLVAPVTAPLEDKTERGLGGSGV